VDHLPLDWQVILPKILVISYPVIHAYVTVSSYLVPVLVVADGFVFCTTGGLPQLTSAIDKNTIFFQEASNYLIYNFTIIDLELTKTN